MGKIKKLLRLDISRDKNNWLTTITCIGVSTIVLMLMYNAFAPYSTPSKATFIITVVVFLANAFIICMKSFKKMEIHQIAFWTILILGVLSLLIQPVMNIPDESVHAMRSEITSRFVLFPKGADTHVTIQALENLFSNGFKSYPMVNDAVKGVMDYTKIDSAMSTVNGNIFIGYIPQALGIMLAKLLHVSAMGLMWLGRFGNLLAYAGLTSLAIKIAPQFKITLFFVAALPMSIQQAASLSPDAMMNVSVFLLIAYFLYILIDERFLIGNKELLIYIIISVFASLTKPTNVVFVALILIIPKTRFKNHRTSFWLKCVAVMVALIAAGGWYAYTLSFSGGTPNQYIVENNVDPRRQIQYILGNPLKWASNFVGTMVGNLFVNLQMLSHFGWLDQNFPLLTISALFIFGGICARKTDVKFTLPARMFIALLAIGSYTVINLALYLGWTSVASNAILGVQGRYLVPLLALVPLVFAPTRKRVDNISCELVKKEISNKNMTIFVSCISTMSCVMLILITVLKYGVNPA